MMFMVPYQQDPEEAAMNAMQRDAKRADFYGGLESLNDEQLVFVLALVDRSSNDHDWAKWLNGFLVAMAKFDRGLCMCGNEPHTHKPEHHFVSDDGNSARSQDRPAKTAPVQTEAERLTEELVLWMGPVENIPKSRFAELVPVPKGFLPNNTDAAAAYGLYNMALTFDEDKLKLICSGCGISYPSMEDRMLKKPGVAGCEYCQDLEKRGGKPPW